MKDDAARLDQFCHEVAAKSFPLPTQAGHVISNWGLIFGYKKVLGGWRSLKALKALKRSEYEWEGFGQKKTIRPIS